MSQRDEAARTEAMGHELLASAIDAGLARCRSDTRQARMQIEAIRAMLDQVTDAVHRVERELATVADALDRKATADRTRGGALSH